MPVTVIIPAYNEERTVGAVVETAWKASSLVREVIVVDDGSTDATAANAFRAGGKLIRLPANAGKTQALLAGARQAREETLLFLDADLLGLRPVHLYHLAEPVLQQQADMAIGVFRGGRLATDLAQLLAPQLSGQRALSRRLFLLTADALRPGFAVEVVLNAYAKKLGLAIVQVALEGVSHVTKEEKRGLWPGFRARMHMYLDIWRGLT